MLKITNYNKTYPNGKHAVKNLNIEVSYNFNPYKQ